MARALAVTIGTIPGGSALSGMVADGLDVTDGASVALDGVRALADSLGVTDLLSAVLSDGSTGWGASWGAAWGG